MISFIFSFKNQGHIDTVTLRRELISLCGVAWSRCSITQWLWRCFWRCDIGIEDVTMTSEDFSGENLPFSGEMLPMGFRWQLSSDRIVTCLYTGHIGQCLVSTNDAFRRVSSSLNWAISIIFNKQRQTAAFLVCNTYFININWFYLAKLTLLEINWNLWRICEFPQQGLKLWMLIVIFAICKIFSFKLRNETVLIYWLKKYWFYENKH